MPVELHESRDAANAGTVATVVSRARHRRRGWLLLGAFGWSTWVWTTRLWNMFSGSEMETRSTGFIAVHSALYLTSLAVGAVVGVIGWRMLREGREAGS